MKIVDRIAAYIDFKGISLNSFDKSIGASNGYIGKQIKNGASVGSDIIEKIISIYQDLNFEWLIKGTGPMILTDEKPLAMPSMVPGEGIPLIPFDAMAGVCQGDISVMELDCERYVVPVFRGADFLMPVKGSSMYPKYSSGDIVACKKIPLNDLFFQWNKVYVLDTVQGPLIKRVLKGVDPDHILAVSENEKYEPFELHLSQLRAVAIVMGVIRLE